MSTASIVTASVQLQVQKSTDNGVNYQKDVKQSQQQRPPKSRKTKNKINLMKKPGRCVNVQMCFISLIHYYE